MLFDDDVRVHTGPDRDPDPDSDPDSDHNPDPDSDSDPDRDPDPDSDSDPDRDPDRDSDHNHDSDPDRDPDRDRDCGRHFCFAERIYFTTPKDSIAAVWMYNCVQTGCASFQFFSVNAPVSYTIFGSESSTQVSFTPISLPV